MAHPYHFSDVELRKKIPLKDISPPYVKILRAFGIPMPSPLLLPFYLNVLILFILCLTLSMPILSIVNILVDREPFVSIVYSSAGISGFVSLVSSTRIFLLKSRYDLP